MSRKSAVYIAIIAASILGLGIATFLFAEKQNFWGNIFSNLFAEFLGFALGVIATAAVGSELAKERLNKLAPDIFKLIAQLRAGGTIKGPAARACVVLVVRLISEKSIEDDREGVTLTLGHCNVCGLEAFQSRQTGKCSFCRLGKGVWDIKLDPEPKLPESEKDIVKISTPSKTPTESRPSE